MSGGSLDYICFRIEEIAPKVPDRELRNMTFDFAKLLHDLEWYLSSDTSEEDWKEARDNFKKKWFGKRDERLQAIIEESVEELKSELLEMIGSEAKR